MKISTDDCTLCGKSHKGFTLKRDVKGIDHVICGQGPTAKRVNVKLYNPLSGNTYQPGRWKID